MEKMNGTCSEEERIRRNLAKNERKRLYKERVRKEKEPIEVNGLRYFYPYVGGKKGLKRVICDYPMSSKTIPIIYRDANLIVVNKIAPLNSNKCSGYGQSNLRSALKKQLDLHGRLSMIHRLDICTTGVVLTTTDKNSASYFQSLIQKRGVTKIYIAQVKGFFPEHTLIKCESKVDGKDSFTQFLRVDAINSSTSTPSSLVICFPKTGRRHQIRKHLKELGYPILNDPVYSNTNDTAYFDPYLDDHQSTLLKMLLHAQEKYKKLSGVDLKELQQHIRACKHRNKELDVHDNKDSMPKESIVGPWTGCCTRPIYLHSWIYAGKGGLAKDCNKDPAALGLESKWSFCAELPAWAHFTLPPNFQEDNYFSSKLGLDKELAKLVTENLGEGGETDNGEIHDANAKFQSKNRGFDSMNVLPQTKKYKVTCSGTLVT